MRIHRLRKSRFLQGVAVRARSGPPRRARCFLAQRPIESAAERKGASVGPEMLTDGTAGVRAAGFFGLDWSVETGDFAWRE